MRTRRRNPVRTAELHPDLFERGGSPTSIPLEDMTDRQVKAYVTQNGLWPMEETPDWEELPEDRREEIIAIWEPIQEERMDSLRKRLEEASEWALKYNTTGDGGSDAYGRLHDELRAAATDAIEYTRRDWVGPGGPDSGTKRLMELMEEAGITREILVEAGADARADPRQYDDATAGLVDVLADTGLYDEETGSEYHIPGDWVAWEGASEAQDTQGDLAEEEDAWKWMTLSEKDLSDIESDTSTDHLWEHLHWKKSAKRPYRPEVVVTVQIPPLGLAVKRDAILEALGVWLADNGGAEPEEGLEVWTQPGRAAGEGFTIRELGAHELEHHGDVMGHCVGRGSYQRAVSEGRIKIYAMYTPKGTPRFTIELLLDGGEISEVHQVKGRSNSLPTKPAEVAALAQFLEHLGVNPADVSDMRPGLRGLPPGRQNPDVHCGFCGRP